MKDLIIQGCIKLLEPVVLIKIRKSDLEFVKKLIPEAEREFKSHMAKETGVDKYQTQIQVIEDEFIDSESLSGKCGGVILMNENKTITCFNTLDSRLQLTYDESLPHLRKILFPGH